MSAQLTSSMNQNSHADVRDEEDGSGPSRQLSLQPADSSNEDPSGPSTSDATCKDGKVLRKCTCKKSRCLKLYCECFAAGKAAFTYLS